MNKYAAEKIASSYYNAGYELALHNSGITKLAKLGPLAKALAKGTGLAGLGAGLGAGGVVLSNPGLRAETQQGLANFLTRGKTHAEAAANKAIKKLEESAAASAEANARALDQTNQALAKSQSELTQMANNLEQLAIDKVVKGAYPDMLLARAGDPAALTRLEALGGGEVGKAIQKKMQGIQGVGAPREVGFLESAGHAEGLKNTAFGELLRGEKGFGEYIGDSLKGYAGLFD